MPGRRAVAIREHGCAARNHDLRAIRQRDLAATALLPERAERLPAFLVRHQLAAEQLGDRGSRAIVARGSEAAGGDDGAGPIERVAHGGRDIRRVVADGCASNDRHANRRELAREVRGVGVDRVAEQQLVADGDQFDVHGTKAISYLRVHASPR